MKLKTSELTGAALDWAVCMANGMKPEEVCFFGGGPWRAVRDEDGRPSGKYMTGPDLLFSRKWEAGGPIIERKGIATRRSNGNWYAMLSADLGDGERAQWSKFSWAGTPKGSGPRQVRFSGPTPLIAAMRCYVASKLGDAVDVPKELA